MEIVIRRRRGHEETERLARELLAGGADTGDDHVLACAVSIAEREGLAVTFRLDGTAKRMSPDIAYRLIFERGLDIRQC